MTSTTRLPAILGDWGTSRLRLYLCDLDGTGAGLTVRGSASGPGAKFTEDFPAALRDAEARLPGHPANCPVVLAGMVGSNIGWQETPYVSCPVEWSSLTASAVEVSLDHRAVVILPGASCTGRFGYPDVMRGEEMQLLGLSTLLPAGGPRRLVCLPGTHTKWATLDATGLRRFATTVQGELYELLRQDSVLIRAQGRVPQPHTFDMSSFSAAVGLIRDHGDLGLMEALFSVRSRAAAGEPAIAGAEAWLSGLLVGVDIRDTGMVVLAREKIEPPVLLAGSTELTGIYSAALTQFGIPAERFAGDDCAVRGLASAARRLTQESSVEA